jgi:hypothetical protein
MPKKKSGRSLPLITTLGSKLSTDWGWLAQMALFHRHPAASTTHEFHFRQLILAHMFGVGIGCAAKTAFTVIAARAAQVSGLVGDCTARFTCIGHGGPP